MLRRSGVFSMKWYPWLNAPYRQILSRYQQACGHHALLLHTQAGNGEISLCYALSRWLMCRKPDGIKSCGVCHSCHLMMAANHPDFYQADAGQGRQSLGVDTIRTISDSAYNRAHQGGVKVIWMPHAEQLTEPAGNALLKIVEEPPEKTYFLLCCQTPARLLPTLRSRCLYWELQAPNEAVGLHWLRQVGGHHHNELSARTALGLCGGAPLAAAALLEPARWQDRLTLCTGLQEGLSHGDFLVLLPVMNRHKDEGPLYWWLSLLSDALKWQHGAQKFIVNADRISLIAALAARLQADVLHEQWRRWLHCLRQCQEISWVNRELLLTHYLLEWEQCIADAHAAL